MKSEWKQYGFHKSRAPKIKVNKLRIGPGGINCNCCTHGFHPTTFKRKYRKLERTLLKRELNNQIEEALSGAK